MPACYHNVFTKYGECRITNHHNHKLKIPLIQSALNKTEFFINRSRELHGDRYDYSKSIYKSNSEKLIIICKEHGEFLIKPNGHLSKKSGCPKCAEIQRRNTHASSNSYFIDRATLIHENKYDYSLTLYTRQHAPVKIICPIHGEFFQKPKDHLKGSGCNECGKLNISKARGENPTGWEYTRWVKAGKDSFNFDSFKVYIIRCYNDKESFIKVGKTYQKVENRFRTQPMMPYKYEIIKEIISNGYNVCRLEEKIKRDLKEHSYKPKLEFAGYYECFNESCLTKLKENGTL